MFHRAIKSKVQLAPAILLFALFSPAASIAEDGLLPSPDDPVPVQLPTPAIPSLSPADSAWGAGYPVLPKPTVLGKGSIDEDFLREAFPRDPGLPPQGSVRPPDIDQELAVRVATARAVWEWGDNVQFGAVVPLFDANGMIFAYDVDFTIDGSAFGGYEQVAREWRDFCAHRAQELENLPSEKGESSARPRDWDSRRYASVTVSATYDAPPIRGSRRGVSNYYAAGWVAAHVAANALGSGAALTRVVFVGSWERLFEFSAPGRSIFVQGVEPRAWYDRDEYATLSLEGLDLRVQYLQEKAASLGLDVEKLRNDYRTENQSSLNDWLARTVPPERSTYIPGYNTSFTPYRWFGGCSPTAASMVFNYWDEYSWYGRMTNFYRRATDPAEGNLKCHVSDILPLMRAAMTTTDDGMTLPQCIYPGMVLCALARGYCFSDGLRRVGDPLLGWGCNKAEDEIDQGYPLVYSLTYYPDGGIGHSVAVVGYDTSPKPDDYWCYNTWSDGAILERCPCSGHWYDFNSLDAPRPGCRVLTNTKLTAPDGFQVYNSCGASGILTGGNPFDITWTGVVSNHVQLDYSTDGGSTWYLITSNTPDDGSYTWNVPCINSNLCRVRIRQLDSSGSLLSGDGSYGDFAIVTSPPLPAPIPQTPPDGATCQGTSGTLQWTNVPGATGYLVQIGTSCGSGGESFSPTNSYTYPNLTPDGVYYWRVKTRNACGQYGAYSACFHFHTVPGSPQAPVLLEPPNGATCQGTSGTLRFSIVPEAVAYSLQIGTSCGSGTEHEFTPNIWSPEPLFYTEAQYTNLSTGTTYYWRLKTKTDCGVWGSYSACSSFTTRPAPLPSPTLQSPANGGAADASGILNWTDVAGANGYKVQIGTACGTGSEHDVTASQYSYSELQAGTTYYWRVKTKDSCGVYGDYSPCFSFTVRRICDFTWVETGNPYTVIIQSATKLGGPLSVGDEIGLFDTYDNHWICVGGATFQGTYPLVATAWQADPTYGLAGFTLGHTIKAELCSAGDTLCTTPVWTTGGHYGDEGYSVASLMAFGSCVCPRACALSYPRWNWVTVGVRPEDLSPPAVFGSLLPNLAEVRDDVGNVYITGQVSNLNSIDLTNGYAVLLQTQPGTLSIVGTLPDLAADVVPIAAGRWNLIPYLTDECSMACADDITIAMASIADCVDIVKDDEGRIWIPGLGINTIGRMKPCEGYYIYLSCQSDQTLRYPPCSGRGGDLPAIAQTARFIPRETGWPEAVVVTSAAEGLLTRGDELGFYCGTTLVGSAVFEGTFPLSVAVWRGNTDHDMPGFTLGSSMEARIWDVESGRSASVHLSGKAGGAPTYSEVPYTLVSLGPDRMVRPANESAATAVQEIRDLRILGLVPNPSRGQVEVRYQVPQAGAVRLEVYDVAGRIVRVLSEGTKSRGMHSGVWDGTEGNGHRVGAGAYFVQIVAGNERHERRLLVIR